MYIRGRVRAFEIYMTDILLVICYTNIIHLYLIILRSDMSCIAFC